MDFFNMNQITTTLPVKIYHKIARLIGYIYRVSTI